MSVKNSLWTFIAILLAICIDSVFAVPNFDTAVTNYNGQLFLDSKKNYHVEWLVNWEEAKLQFTLTVETTGWVGFGFSKDGTMKDADIVIAGVTGDGQPYISDMFADCHRELRRDNKQDWKLLNSFESNGRTVVTISRLIDTCDSEDYPITDDLVYMLWSFGEFDTVEYHHQERGSYQLYLLDPVVHPAPSSVALPKWKATLKFTIPNKITTYWCSIHKAPRLPRKQHIIEAHPVLEGEVAVAHTHHFVLWQCLVPEGVDPRSIFEPLVSYGGEECYFNDHNRIPINMCRRMKYVWALGGRPLILPDYVGIPFGEQPDEYYMLETHYNNPEAVGGITYESGVELTYSDRLRRKDGGTLLLNYEFFGFYMIPPGTLSMQIFTHCPAECTNMMIPPEGIDIFAVHTHTHGSGRKNKLHQYRNGRELPWIIKDDNYDYLFQNPRILQRERKVLPGDHLMLECVDSDSWTNVTTTAGFAGTDEMCLQVLYHTNPIPYSTCSAQIPQERLLNLIGVQNVTWDTWTQERIVTSPANLRGQTLAHVMDFRVKWTKTLRERVIDTHIQSSQVVTCPTDVPPPGPPDHIVSHAQAYGQQMLFGTSPVPPPTPPGPTIITKKPVVIAEYARVRNCPVSH